MYADIAAATHNDKLCGYLPGFAPDAERFLASLYHCVRQMYGERAAHSAAEGWLQVFEERLEELTGPPELTRITAAAVARFVSTNAERLQGTDRSIRGCEGPS